MDALALLGDYMSRELEVNEFSETTKISPAMMITDYFRFP